MFAWWTDFFAASAVLLAVMLLTSLVVRQPVHRMAIAWSGIAGMLVLAVLCAVPMWPKIGLFERRIVEWKYHQPLEAGRADVAARVSPDASPPSPLNRTRENVAPANVALIPRESAADSENARSEAGASFGKAQPLAWLRGALVCGAAIIVAWLAVGQFRVWRLCRRATAAPADVDAELRNIIGSAARPPRLLVQVSVSSAVATGTWRPTILLPAHIVNANSFVEQEAEPMNACSLRAMLAHEWGHIERRDLWLLAIGRLLLVALFANPLYWLLWRRIRSDQEMLADHAACNHCGRHAYAETLVHWARELRQRESRLGWTIGIWERPSQLSRRIAMLLDEKIQFQRSCSRRLRSVTIGAAVVVVGGLSPFTLNPPARALAVPVVRADRIEKSAKAPMADATQVLVHIEGICTDAKRKPIANATVRLFRIDDSEKDFLRPGGRMKWVKTAMDDPAEKKEMPLTFQAGYGDPAKQRMLQETRTDADGRFHFSELPADEGWKSRRDTVWVVVQAAGKATSFSDPALRKHADGKPFVEPLKVRLETAASIRGRIMNADGEPVRGAIVTPTEFNYLPKPVPGILTAVTDAEGKYEINDSALFDVEHLPPTVLPFGAIRQASVMLAVEHADYAPGAVEYTKTPTTVDHVLQRPATLRGRVVLDEDDSRAAKCRVTWTHESGLSVSAETDEAGNYQLERLVPGSYTIQAKRKENDRLPASQKLSLVAGENRLDLRLKVGGLIKGRFVVDATGQTPQIEPSSFSSVMTVNAHLEGHDATDPSQVVQAYMEKDGSFLMPVEPGRQLLVIWHPQWQLVDAERWGKEGVETAKGQTAEVELRLAPRQGGWANLIAEARATEAAAKGKPAPPPMPEPVESAVAPDPNVLGDDGRMLKSIMDWPDELMPQEAMSYEAVLPMLEPFAAAEYATIDGEEHMTSISFGDSAEMFQDDRTGPMLWIEYSLLAHIDRFPHLQTVMMLGAPGDDAWLEPLRGNKALHGLVFAYPKKLTPAGIRILATLPNLQTLCAMGFTLNDDALKEVQRFPKLEALQFGGFVTDAGVAHLQGNAKLKALMIMSVGKPQLTDEALRYAATLPNLESLSIGTMTPGNQLAIGDDGLKHLAAHGKLRELSISGALITDAGLVHLRGVKSLKSVDFENTFVTPKGMSELKKALPELKTRVGTNPAIRSK
jgi:beta-lactamase regulating signal transducer with metallopeptidase domain